MKRFLFAAAFASFGSGAFAAVVDFEGVVGTPTNFPSPPGLVFEGLTFTSVAGAVDPILRIFTDAGPRTDYLLACDAADFGVSNPCEDVTLGIDFGAAIETLSFSVVSDNDPLTSVFATFFTGGGNFDRIAGGFDGVGTTKDAVTFGGLGGATSVFLSSNDPAGVGYDDFSVIYSGGSPDPVLPPIPLPAGLPLLLSALGLGAVIARRRRRS